MNELNQLELVKTQEVTRKVQPGRFSNVVDSEKNVVSKFTLIKIRDRNDPMRGQLGEVRALYHNTLFVWIKNSLLVKTNGIYAVTPQQVVNAGAQHMKEANELAGLVPYSDNQAHPDRKIQARMRGEQVLITKGHLKGFRGSVMTANESTAEVHVHAKCKKFVIQRADLQVVYNPNEGMRVQQGNAANVPMHVGFDEAAN